MAEKAPASRIGLFSFLAARDGETGFPTAAVSGVLPPFDLRFFGFDFEVLTNDPARESLQLNILRFLFLDRSDFVTESAGLVGMEGGRSWVGDDLNLALGSTASCKTESISSGSSMGTSKSFSSSTSSAGSFLFRADDPLPPRSRVRSLTTELLQSTSISRGLVVSFSSDEPSSISPALSTGFRVGDGKTLWGLLGAAWTTALVGTTRTPGLFRACIKHACVTWSAIA
mmetsp:Transcript_30517/g.73197  ORF Transcript_30517/g.73197 Transcript_30517/m.73197 type:complete len:228 (+) Transcript_30517:711-1394(+)